MQDNSQYRHLPTGKKDKNGVEISIGSIFIAPTGIDDEGSYPEKYEVKYNQDKCKFVAVFNGNVEVDMDDFDYSVVEVIGRYKPCLTCMDSGRMPTFDQASGLADADICQDCPNPVEDELRSVKPD